MHCQKTGFGEILGICLPVKESNIFVGNVANNFLGRGTLLNTKEQYMKESNTLVGNAVNSFLRRGILLNKKGNT